MPPLAPRRAVAVLVLAAAQSACTSPDLAASDAAADARDVVAPPSDVHASDAIAAQDVVLPSDAAPPRDAPPPRDATDVADATAAPPDVASPRDVSTHPADATRVDDVPSPRDASAFDVPSATDGGTCAATRVTAPTPDEVIETCSASDAPVFYTFDAAADGATRVDFGFRTPDGSLAPPSVTLTSPPWSVRRQVGGPSTGAPALGVFPNALRGSWALVVTVVDRCGRTTTTTQPFSLTFTNRRCPNP